MTDPTLIPSPTCLTGSSAACAKFNEAIERRRRVGNAPIGGHAALARLAFGQQSQFKSAHAEPDIEGLIEVRFCIQDP